MLDRTVGDVGAVEISDIEWHPLTKVERRLICFHRQLTDEEQRQLYRLAELLFQTSEPT